LILEAATDERRPGETVPPELLDGARDADPRADRELRLGIAREKLERRLVERLAVECSCDSECLAELALA